MKLFHNRGFTLVEVVISVGIFAFALVGILGLLPVAETSNRDSLQATLSAELAAQVFTNLRSGPFDTATATAGSVAILPLETSVTLYASDSLELSPVRTPSSTFRLDVASRPETTPGIPPSLTQVSVIVAWGSALHGSPQSSTVARDSAAYGTFIARLR